MACRRLYDPPSDDEVVYYREIKRYIRCAIAYHQAKGKSQGNADDIFIRLLLLE
jgi:hypothetical protein